MLPRDKHQRYTIFIKSGQLQCESRGGAECGCGSSARSLQISRRGVPLILGPGQHTRRESVLAPKGPPCPRQLPSLPSMLDLPISDPARRQALTCTSSASVKRQLRQAAQSLAECQSELSGLDDIIARSSVHAEWALLGSRRCACQHFKAALP